MLDIAADSITIARMRGVDDPSGVGEADAGALVRVLGAAAAPALSWPDRRRILLDGLAELTRSDAWSWRIATGPQRAENAEMGSSGSAELRSRLGAVLEAIGSEATFWLGDRGSAMAHLARSQNGTVAVTALARDASGEPYSDREMRLFRIVAEETWWLREAAPSPKAPEGAAALPPRLRELCVLLLMGETIRAAAAAMGVSEHTARGYAKSLYGRAGVGSRAELVHRHASGELSPLLGNTGAMPGESGA
ncbi:MAG: hypothetical protein AAF297_04795 [Planctomycetota bacterium]